MSLPTLCDPIVLRAMLGQETRLMDLTESILSQSEDWDEEEIEILRNHHSGVILCNELIYCHESASAADEIPHACATQLKAFHLSALDGWITEITKA